MMNAIVLSSTGGPEVLELREIPRPRPGRHEVLVRVEAASVNYADVVRRRGDPYMLPTPLPAVLGSEVAGTIEAVGEEVSDHVVGERVFALFGGNGLGGYAQHAVAGTEALFPIGGLDYDVASTLVVAGVTAYQMLREAARLEPGETVFVPGAAGGVGNYALALAKRFGAGKVIAGARTPERRAEALARGADAAVDYTKDTWPAEVKALTNGRGADVVLDMIGGAFFAQSLSALAPFGRLVTYGTASRERSTLVPQALMARSQSVVGYYVGHWFAERPERSRAAFRHLAELVASGAIHVDVAARLPLARAAEAHHLLETRGSTGKIVLLPWSAGGVETDGGVRASGGR